MRRYLFGILAAAVTAVLATTPAAASDPTLILIPGTKAVFSTSLSSVNAPGVACSSSTISLTATAVTGWTMSNCTSNLPRVTAVPSVAFHGLPYVITSNTTGTIVIHDVSLTIVLAFGNLVVACGYSAPTVSATRSITGTSLTFNEQRLVGASPVTQCPVALFFSARYGPGPA
jgi:hypothetical protein